MYGLLALTSGVSMLALAAPATAQVAPTDPAARPANAAVSEQQAETSPSDQTLSDIVVTGVAQGRNRLDTSVSVSSLDGDLAVRLPPRSAADFLRNLPGVRIEASGGDGNANISVRGLPVATGGSKFLQLQEDGLPILEFGDIIFGNADIFLRTDLSLARIESVRGGSASTFASNSPGGIINFISKTGEQDGGTFQLSSGLDYREYRADFAYGGHIDQDTRYQLSGFYRLGDGARHVGYDALRGGQIRANITHDFDRGYVRLSGKYLDDRSIGYLPVPFRVTGTNDDPSWGALPNFNGKDDVLQSRYIPSVTTLDGDNRIVRRNIGDGMHAVVASVGFEGRYDLSDRWSVTERFRHADISGDFVSPFPAAVGDAQAAANAFAGAGAQLFYASGPLSGQRVANPATLGGNGLLTNVVLFDTDLKSLNNTTNDIRINGNVDFAAGTLSIAAGLYSSRQEIKTDWLWTSLFQTAEANGRSVLIGISNAAGVPQTAGGTTYSATFFGNCCRQQYDVAYNTNAPFAQLGFEIGRLNIDGSLRYDFGSAKGNVRGGNPSAVRAQDMDGDGVISVAERTVAFLPDARSPVDYDYGYLSYSAGVNFRLLQRLALFARYSRGGRANADRLLFGPLVNAQTGDLIDGARPYDFVRQAEGGFKFDSGRIGLYGTVFHARTEETNFLPTFQQFTSRRYKATGVELEGRYRAGPFSLTAAGTYTDAIIASDATDPTLNGNRPQRQAKFVYQTTSQLDLGRISFGANAIGTTSSFTQPVNQLKMPGYVQVNGFILVRAGDRVSFNVNANNIFNVLGVTESEDASITANNIVRARSINPRTIAASVRFDF